MAKKKDNSFLGDDLADIINHAVQSGNYSSLNREITNALNKAADALHDGLTDAVLGTGGDFFRTSGAQTWRAQSTSAYDTAASKVRHNATYNEAKSILTGSGGVASPVGGVLRMVFSGFTAVFCGILTMGGFGIGSMPFALFFLLCTIFAGWNWQKGRVKISRCKRARKILQMMAGRDTITVEEIAAAFGKDSKWVADDIQEMIRTGVFTGPTYMDKEETAFMTTQQAYNQYLATMAEYQKRVKEEKKKAKSVFQDADLKEYHKMEEGIAAREKSEAAHKDQLTKETQEMLSEGRAFIAHIHQKNEEIPGEAFSDKLYRLEKIVTDIFERVASEPESAPDLHRMMKYYLPITQKLVDTYATLDKQTVEGENIQSAKREIEASLDTINSAFERFLDSFFQHTAWDVSSDISVLGTMMAQDGLTGGGDFRQKSSGAAQASSGARAQAQAAAQTQTAAQAASTPGAQAQAASAAQAQAASAAQAQTASAAQAQTAVQKESAKKSVP